MAHLSINSRYKIYPQRNPVNAFRGSWKNTSKWTCYTFIHTWSFHLLLVLY